MKKQLFLLIGILIVLNIKVHELIRQMISLVVLFLSAFKILNLP